MTLQKYLFHANLYEIPRMIITRALLPRYNFSYYIPRNIYKYKYVIFEHQI